MTQLEEKYIFKKFSESTKLLPKGNPIFSDEPDVIYTTETGSTIGIEITESYYNEKLKASSEFSIKFNNELIQNIENSFGFTFILEIELDFNNPIKTKFRKSLIEELRKIFTDEFSELSPKETKKLENIGNIDKFDESVKALILKNGYRNLPLYILSITMTRLDELKKSFHLESNGDVVPEFNDVILSKIIKNKDKSFLHYNKCDQNWLLISEGMDFYSYFNGINIKETVLTNFDKIFLYRRFTSEVIEIK